MTSKFQELLNGDIPILIDFYATWCAPCQTMMPTIDSIAKQMNGKLKVIKVDIDKNMDAVKSFKVRGVPTFALYKKGKQLWKKPGVIPQKEFMQVFKAHKII